MGCTIPGFTHIKRDSYKSNSYLSVLIRFGGIILLTSLAQIHLQIEVTSNFSFFVNLPCDNLAVFHNTLAGRVCPVSDFWVISLNKNTSFSQNHTL